MGENVIATARETWRKVLGLLTPHERRRGVIVCALMVANAMIATIGVASVLPVLAVLGNPGMIETNPALRWAYETFGFPSTNRFLLVLGAASVLIVVMGAVVQSVTEYAIVRYGEMRRHSLSTRLLHQYLQQPYHFFLGRNSAELSQKIFSEVEVVVDSVLIPALRVPANAIVAATLVALLVIVDFQVAFGVALAVGGAFAAMYLVISRLLARLGEERVRTNRARFVTAAEAFGGIKDIKLLGREAVYLSRFQEPSFRFSAAQALARALALLPRYMIEAIGFGGVLAMAVVLMGTGQDLGHVLPMLGLYAFAGYRLLPAAQHIYHSVTALRFGLSSVDDLYEDLRRLETAPAPQVTQRMSLRESMRWVDVTFRYPDQLNPALEGVTLEIPAGTTAAFVGETGSGKTTAVDLILGLLRPTGGSIYVDGTLLDGDHVRFWQNSIGHVPQHVYLADDTVIANIAFGVPEDEVCLAAVEQAARLAGLHNFIVRQLPKGYRTTIGERGVRLSGGQRQRLGIARALYTDPEVLVLDEATSALDTSTEREVMTAVYDLEGRKTVIMVAHRLSTVRHAARIFLLEEGRLVDQGSFAELARRSPRFREMAAGVPQ